MPLVKPPEGDPAIEPFRDGVGELRLNGELAGHVATSLSEFWSPGGAHRQQAGSRRSGGRRRPSQAVCPRTGLRHRTGPQNRCHRCTLGRTRGHPDDRSAPGDQDEQLVVLRILADRRRSLGEDHTRMVSQLHQWLLGLIPGGATKDLSARQAKAPLAKVPPRCSWQDPSPRRRGTDQRPGADLRAEEGRRQGAHRAGRRVRHRANEPARDRPLRHRSTARRGR